MDWILVIAIAYSMVGVSLAATAIPTSPNHVYMFTRCDYKNLAIANRSRVSCINTNNNTMTLKSGLEVTQGH